MSIFFKSLLSVFIFWAIVVSTWIIGLIYFLPFKYWWFDVVMHFLGGLWVLSLILFLQNRFAIDLNAKNHFFAPLFVFVGLVVFAGVVWEFLEFMVDRHILKTGFTFMRGVYEDTLIDLLMDILGGAFGAVIYLLSNKNKNA